jgi:hypothetical protein
MVTAAPPSKVAGPVRSDGNKRAPLLPAYRALLLSRTHIRWTRFPRWRGTRTVSPGEGPLNELSRQENRMADAFGFSYFAMLNAGISSIDVSEV